MISRLSSTLALGTPIGVGAGKPATGVTGDGGGGGVTARFTDFTITARPPAPAPGFRDRLEAGSSDGAGKWSGPRYTRNLMPPSVILSSGSKAAQRTRWPFTFVPF